jgi:hypothetical protein
LLMFDIDWTRFRWNEARIALPYWAIETRANGDFLKLGVAVKDQYRT